MFLRFTNADGKLIEVELGSQPVTIGRSAEADIVVPSEKASRVHCAIRQWDGDFILKDMRSRNATFVNERRIDVAILKPGDRIKVGSVVIDVDRKASKGASTLLREVGAEMEEGKGYRTILREIVRKADGTKSGSGA